ncbi:MAG TPA: glycoside hydrolase family 3 N-terminal domain-containing protein [Ktedonobacteraceae bacterium]|nr:glycoside hydrolase family 3 N-terminal domain-containing protein [Ktedonobacteraceae bacterium]
MRTDGGPEPSASSRSQPRATIPARPRPSRQDTHYKDQTSSDIPTRPLVPPSLPPVSVQVVQAQMPRRRKRRTAIPILVTLAVLCLLVAFGAIYAPRYFGGTETQVAPTSGATGHTGPFVQPPLNPAQVNALQHLVSHMQYKQLASLYVERMSLDEEIGQLIMVEYGDTSYSSDLDYMLNTLHAGGVIMYEFQMLSFNQTKHDIAEMQKRATFPLLISADEEGGPYVHRLLHIYPPRMSATQIYETGNPNVATQQGKLAAQQLSALGINVNLAPDVDVQLVPGYDLVTRTFGYTPQSVITYAGAYMQALQGDGVIATIKHYPGLGDATGDAHQLLPVINRTKAQIYATELAPYRTFIQSQNKLLNPGIIMPTDLLMPAIDPVMPAELSPIFMTDILRKQLGYDGVTLTDALYMKGITQKWSMPEAAVLALKAGNDMILGPTGTAQTIAVIEAIKAALQDGTLSKARIDEAATRILALKMQYHLMPAIPPQ